MGAATAVSGGLGALKGFYTAISEAKNKKKIAKEIANQKEVPLTNIADGMQVSTRGADLQKEEQARLAATQTGALADAGSRALGVGIGRVSAQNQNLNAEIGANLDEQQNNITNVRAQDEQRIQTTKEQRANAKLAALSSQYNASSQNMMGGIGNAIGGVGMVGNAQAGTEKPAKTTKVKPNFASMGAEISTTRPK